MVFFEPMRKKIILFITSVLVLFLLFSNLSVSVSSYRISDKNFFENETKKNFDLTNLFSKVNESDLKNYVENIESFGPHPTGSKELNELKIYLYNVFDKIDLNIDLIPWKNKDLSGENIEATLEGRNDKMDIFVICAHYDSVEISPGADDDGSGVSIVLMLANVLSNYIFNSTIKFVLFSGEEQGLLGSKSYVEKISEENLNIAGVLNLDGVGYASTTEDGSKIRHYANTESSWMQEISKSISKKYDEYIGLEVLTLPHVTFSDHQSFVEKGYDASYFLENSLNPFYHTSEDISENMNFTYLSKVCKLSMGLIVSMAELNPKSSEENIDINIKGEFLTKTGQLSVEILNKNYPLDTTNLTINIKFEPVLKIFNKNKDPCNWTIEKEIKDKWFFKTINRGYVSGLFRIRVELKGFNDDIYIYKNLETVGIVLFKYYIFLIPKIT